MDDVLVTRAIARTYEDPSGTIDALRPTDLAVAARDWLTIMGPSGSGKSTLLGLLGLLDMPTEGTYVVRGAETTNMSERQRTRLRATTFGFVFQAFHLPAYRTALDAVLMGSLYLGRPRRERRDEALRMLDRVGLGSRTETEARLLSGGQRQRIAIARALVGDPAVLLCDEPTGNLDSGTASDVLALLSELRRQRDLAVVVVTHDPAVAEHSTRALGITDGRCHEL